MICQYFNSPLGIHDVQKLADISCQDPSYQLDLSDVPYVHPAGIVSLVLVAVKRSQQRRLTHIVVPKNGNILNYLERIDFFRKLENIVIFDRDVSHLANNKRKESDNFSEIATPKDSNFEQISKVFYKFFIERIPDSYRKVYSTFEEILKNIRDHSNPNASGFAYSCVQSQIYSDRIELAFGDLGQGFLHTLKTNRLYEELATEAEALEGALVNGYSRLKNINEERGGGLRRVSEIVSDCNGKMQIISRNGIYRGSHSFMPEFKNVSTEFPGTFVSIMIPTITRTG